MKQITIREFCLRPAFYLEDLPISLVRYSRVVAIVSDPEKDPKIAEVEAKLAKLPIKPMPKKFVKEVAKLEKTLDDMAGVQITEFGLDYEGKPPKTQVVPFTLNKNFNVWVCAHNNEEGYCPMGCRRAK